MTDQSAGALYKITGLNNPKPTIVAQSVALANPTGLALGPDGDVWVDQMAGSVQRVKPDGSADGAAIPTGGTNLQSIAKSTDNALLWVTDLNDGPGGSNGLIKITTDAVHTATPVRIGAGKGPRGVTAASDGRIYFAESSGVAGEKIGRVNADGSNPQESSALTGGASDPEGVAFGPDGNLYVAIFNTAQVGQVAPGLGPITQFKPGISGTMGPREIAMGADKNLWFTNETNNKVGRLTVDPPPTPAPPNNGGGSSSSGGGTTANTSGTTTPVLPVPPGRQRREPAGFQRERQPVPVPGRAAGDRRRGGVRRNRDDDHLQALEGRQRDAAVPAAAARPQEGQPLRRPLPEPAQSPAVHAPLAEGHADPHRPAGHELGRVLGPHRAQGAEAGQVRSRDHGHRQRRADERGLDRELHGPAAQAGQEQEELVVRCTAC
jgi:streptogramin lyase